MCQSTLQPQSKRKQLELATPNYSIAVARHALTWRSKGHRSRSHCYKNHHGRMVASEVCCCCRHGMHTLYDHIGF